MKKSEVRVLHVGLASRTAKYYNIDPENGEYETSLYPSPLIKEKYFDYPVALLEGFDVVYIIPKDNFSFDLKKAIEESKPDFIMFATTGESRTPDHAKVVAPYNVDVYPEIPRIICANADKISPLSSAGIMLGSELRVEANFSSIMFGRESNWLPYPSFYLPQAAGIDSTLFKDYGEEKVFCIGMFGSGYFNDGFYPWREQVAQKVLGKFPVVHYPTPVNDLTKHLPYPRVSGEDYARAINKCQFVFACGSATKTVLAKHFEIPASRSCLVTEDTSFLRAHGFIDGENCVCVTPDNVLEKLEYLLSNLRELERITENGYRFVHEEWLNKNRDDNLFEWFKLRKNLQADKMIVQSGVTEFSVVAINDNTVSGIDTGEDVISQSWGKGFNFLQQGNTEEAGRCFKQTLAYVGYDPLGRLGMALVNLFTRNSRNCIRYLEATFFHEDKQGGLADYHDPVDLAYYIIANICAGDINKAFGVSLMWRNHTHFALKAARMIAAAAAGNVFDQAAEDKALQVHSRCPVVISSVEGWVNHFRDVFKIYGITI